MESTVSIMVWFIAMLIWGQRAPGLSPFTRNVCAIVPCVAGFILFVVLLRYWKLSLVFLAVGVGAYCLAEIFPKRPEKLSARREAVTFLQDIMFDVGSFWLAAQVFLLMGVTV